MNEVEMELDEKIQDILDDCGWHNYDHIYKQDNEYYIEIETESSLGEDFVETVFFDGTSEGFIKGFKRMAYNFDPDEHAQMWIENRGKRGVPDSIEDLIDDANDLKDLLCKTVRKLENYNEGETDEEVKSLDKCIVEFIDYLHDNYVGFSGFKGSFLRETVENIIRYAYKKYGHSKDEARYFVYDLLPDDVTFREIERFLPEFSVE